jgi:asparagine synthase (glutamine-hydrolysing)
MEFPRALRGMFAIALYDRARKRLMLTRDRVGKKPLYYAMSNGRLIFGSEIKPILIAAPELRRVNTRAIHPFFRFGFIPEPATAFDGIFKLPAGHTLEFRDGTFTIHAYWDLTFPAPNSASQKRSDADYLDELDALLEEAVRIRLRSDVPLGAFLSGGPDSSLLVAYASELTQRALKTFTIGFTETGFDESADARRVAEYCRTDHTLKTLSLASIRREFFATLDQIVRHTDEPFGDSSALPMFYLAKLAREDVTVILAGDGADEVFGGYTIYQGLRFAQLYQRLPNALRQNMIAPLLAQWSNLQSLGEARWRAHTWQKRIADSNLALREMLVSKFSIASSPLLDNLVRDADALDHDARDGTRWIVYGNATNPFEQTLYAGMRFLQVNDMLVKVDRMSMAHSLEVRNPYLDHRVIEFAATIPSRLKLRGWQTKAILRDVAARHLPIQNARKYKHGFGVPISLWFRDALMPQVRERLNASAAVALFLHPPVVNAILNDHNAGIADYGQVIWCLLIFDAWHRLYIETP